MATSDSSSSTLSDAETYNVLRGAFERAKMAPGQRIPGGPHFGPDLWPEDPSDPATAELEHEKAAMSELTAAAFAAAEALPKVNEFWEKNLIPRATALLEEAKKMDEQLAAIKLAAGEEVPPPSELVTKLEAQLADMKAR